jgi:hypothetical protein
MEELWNAVMPFLKKSLSASQEALPQAPAPAEVAHPAPGRACGTGTSKGASHFDS